MKSDATRWHARSSSLLGVEAKLFGGVLVLPPTPPLFPPVFPPVGVGVFPPVLPLVPVEVGVFPSVFTLVFPPVFPVGLTGVVVPLPPTYYPPERLFVTGLDPVDLPPEPLDVGLPPLPPVGDPPRVLPSRLSVDVPVVGVVVVDLESKNSSCLYFSVASCALYLSRTERACD